MAASSSHFWVGELLWFSQIHKIVWMEDGGIFHVPGPTDMSLGFFGCIGSVVLPCETLQETSLRIPWPIHAGRGDGLWKSGYTLWGPRLIAKLVYLPRLIMFYGRDIIIYLYIYIDNGVYKQTYNVRGPHIVWHLQDFFHWLDHHDWIMPASILFYQQHPTLLGTCTNKSGDMKEHTFFYHWNHVNRICFQRPVICTDGFWLVVWNLFFMFPYIGNDDPNWLK